MTSGVYLIKFPGGEQYIGKSINVEERWKQHLHKMKTGKAAKPMQAAWDTYGEFEADYLLKCHSDHIDVVEAHYISRYEPSLNTERPEDPYSEYSYEFIDSLFDNFVYSTVDMVKHAYELQNDVLKLNAEISNLEEDNNMLLEKRTDEELKFDVDCKILGLEQQLKHREQQLNTLSAQVKELNIQLEYYKLPWWKRLFK